MKRSRGSILKKLIVFMTAAVLVAIYFKPVTVSAGSLTKIDATTFAKNTEITTIHIGSDVTEISSAAFRPLLNLRSITVSDSNPYYTSYSNCLYNKDMTELICFPAALSGALIPATVTTISTNALHGVGDSLKEEIRKAVSANAAEFIMESDVPGAHFIHTPYGVKWRYEDGTVTEPETDLMKLVASVVEDCTSDSMTQQQQLQSCFNYFVRNSSYERELDVPIGNWTGSYATDMLMSGKGNCYKYAAAFAYIARGLGYESRVCSGTVTSAMGGRTAHAWTEVKINDTWYIMDAEMQGAKGSGYYKQTYEKYPAGPLIMSASWTVDF